MNTKIATNVTRIHVASTGPIIREIRDVGDILKREPDVAREGHGGPGEGLRFRGGDVDEHDQVVVASTGGVVREVGIRAILHRDGLQRSEFGERLQCTGFARSGIRELAGVDGTEAEGARRDAGRAGRYV